MSAKCHERTYLSATASADWLATRIPFACSRPPAARQQSGISSIGGVPAESRPCPDDGVVVILGKGPVFEALARDRLSSSLGPNLPMRCLMKAA